MKASAVGYWVCTVLVAFSFLSGGVVYLLRVPEVVAGVTSLGYPAYVVTILGVWKLLGGTVVLLPGFPVLKEWAYAGMIFDLTGAAASSAASGAGLRHIIVPLVLAALVLASWALRPESRRLKRT
jgi:DoxX-like protein